MQRLEVERSSRLDITSSDRCRVATHAPIPPARYAGTERIVAALVSGLHRRGHRVTLFAPGDSKVECELVPTVPRSLWSTGYRDDLSAYLNLTLAKVWAASGDFDIIHSHVETLGLPFARWCPTTVVSTFHGRLDGMGHPALLDEFQDVPLVAISESQRRWSPTPTGWRRSPMVWISRERHSGQRSEVISRSSAGSRLRKGSRMPSRLQERPVCGSEWQPRSMTNESRISSRRSSPQRSRRVWSNS